MSVSASFSEVENNSQAVKGKRNIVQISNNQDNILYKLAQDNILYKVAQEVEKLK